MGSNLRSAACWKKTTLPRLGSAALAAVVIAALCLGGCAAVGSQPPYQDVLAQWTRSEKVFVGLDARIYLSATYKDPSFIASYVDRYAAAYKLDDAYKAALLEREKEEAERYNEFFAAVYTPEDSWNDLQNKDSIWRLYLEDGTGARLAPISITRVDKSDPLLREFFPYFDMWSSGYRVKFPKYSDAGAEPIPGPSTMYLRLTVTGIMGEGNLLWRFKE
ncbi:MAG: hypothetical protein HY894_01555 [Deltaproteobacteria bacterium]|nr:hypothetical protein [Deltaproteobacteria bacterium]